MPKLQPDGPTPQWWRFRVHADAERVLLVKQRPDGTSQWSEMTPDDEGTWHATQPLDAGEYRFTYYLIRGETCLNGGDEGLIAEPADAPPATANPPALRRLASA